MEVRPIVPSPQQTAGPGLPASLPERQAPVLWPIKLSAAFAEAGVRRIAGDWLPEQFNRLPTKQQAMITSMLEHLKNSRERAPVLQGCSVFKFPHPHTAAAGSVPGDSGAEPRYLDGALNVDRHGEVISMFIRDPGIGGECGEMVQLKKPEKPVPLCHCAPSGATPRKRAFEELQNRSPGSPSTRQPTPEEAPGLLATQYSDIKPDAAVRMLLDNADSGSTPLKFYPALRKLKGDGGKNWRSGICHMLDGFGAFLATGKKSLRDVMQSFDEFARAAAAYQESCRDEGTADQGTPARNARHILQHICELSFGENPLTQYVDQRISDPGSPLHELCKEGKVGRFIRGNTYIINVHAVAKGKASVADLFGHSAHGAIMAGEEIGRTYPSNKNLQYFMRLLRRDMFPLPLDATFGKALDISANAQSQDESMARKRMETTTKIYANFAYRIAEYGCVYDESEKILQLLKSFPWQGWGESIAAARKMAMENFRPIVEWAGADPRQFRSTVNALAHGLALMAHPSSA